MIAVIIGNMAEVVLVETDQQARELRDELFDHPKWKDYSTTQDNCRSPHLMAGLSEKWGDVRTATR